MNREQRRAAARSKPIEGAYEIEKDHWVVYERGIPIWGTRFIRDSNGDVVRVLEERIRHDPTT